jgi:hypothetical protein
MGKIPRPQEDLQRELSEQLRLLAHSCASYDAGLIPAGKYIAISLRLLLHERGKSSQSLLGQVGLRTGQYVDSTSKFSSTNLLPFCDLVIARVVATGAFVPATVIPALGRGPFPPRLTQFDLWWADTVLRDAKGGAFSRQLLVGYVADTDGGGHVDPALQEEYVNLSRIYGLGWEVGSGPFDPGPDAPRLFVQGRIELACMRQIAWELLQTLRARGIEAAKDDRNPMV